MKRGLIIILLMFSVTVVVAQTKCFNEIKSSVDKVPDRSMALMNEEGTIIGSYHISAFVDKPYEVGIVQNSSNVTIIDPLSFFTFPSNKNIIVNYGDFIYSHILFNLHLRIYSTTGNLISSKENLGKFPYATAVSSNGNLYTAANTSTNENMVQNTICKYDISTSQLWSNNLPQGWPSKIALTSTESYSAVGINKNETNQFSVFIFNEKGKAMGSIEKLEGLTALSFLNNDLLIICDYNNWYLYKPGNNPSLLKTGKLIGNPLGAFPITSSTKGDWFLIVSMKSDGVINLQAIDVSTGEIINECNYNGDTYWQEYRYASVDENNIISLFTGTRMIHLSINR